MIYKNIKYNSKIKLPKEFIDKRGVIKNLINFNFGSCVLISSNINSIRANHYHKKHWHFIYVLSGQIEYYYRKVGSSRKPNMKIFVAEDLFFTPPMYEHALLFKKKTNFITLGKASRTRRSYENDLVRVKLI
jgi:dTDP-4-dehydrorhamnose 3,5-epimerase-like enzyme